MSIDEHISKQLEAGFSYDEIRKNLAAENFSDQEIKESYNRLNKTIKKAGGANISGGQIVSIIFGVFIVLRLIYRFYKIYNQ